jgi:Trk K+ transport system NAD-binding subunit
MDITVRAESKLANKPFNELPVTNSLIGAVIRNRTVMFPHGSDVLKPGDRAILFVETARAADVERAL